MSARELLPVKQTLRRSTWSITVLYAGVGVLWILLSDRAATMLAGDAAQGAIFQTVKGIGFVAVTALLLFLLMRANARRVERMMEEVRKSQKLEAVGRFAAGVAHDFNNCLTVIGGQVSLARECLPRTHEAAIALGGADIAVEQAASLVSSMLSLSRVINQQRTEVEVDEIASGAVKLLSPLMPSRVRMELYTSAPGVRVSVVAPQVRQVIANLSINARDAMPLGGTLRIGTRCEQDSDGRRWAAIDVQDTGEGITPEVMQRLFEPFFTTKPVGIGTGLGLSVSRDIVQELGGSIRVTSQVGKGSVFTVRLPATLAPAGSASGVQMNESWLDSDQPPDVDAEAIVLEDNPHVRSLIRGLLGSEGLRTLTMRSVRDFLTALDRDRPPRLFVCDVQLPDGNGADAVKAAVEKFPGTPVIVISGAESIGKLPEGTILLRKPFSPIEFKAQVAKCLAVKVGT